MYGRRTSLWPFPLLEYKVKAETEDGIHETKYDSEDYRGDYHDPSGVDDDSLRRP